MGKWFFKRTATKARLTAPTPTKVDVAFAEEPNHPATAAAQPSESASKTTSDNASSSQGSAAANNSGTSRNSTPITTSSTPAPSQGAEIQLLLGAEVIANDNLPTGVQQALGTIVAIAQQMDARLARVERQLDELDPHSLGLASTDDVHALRIENARLSGELSKATIDLRDRIDQVEFNQPTTPAHEARVNRLAQQILTLSDSYTNPNA